MKKAPRRIPPDEVKEYYLNYLKNRDNEENKFCSSWFRYIDCDAVLNLGCGPSFYDYALSFARLPKYFVGMGINVPNINFLQESKHPELLGKRHFFKHGSIKTEFVIWDIRKKRKSFLNKFDAVYTINIFARFSRDEVFNIFEIVKSYLKPNGLFLLIDRADIQRNEYYYPIKNVNPVEHQLTDREYSNRSLLDLSPEYKLTIELIEELLKRAGFKIIKNEIHEVSNKEEYGWGKLYAYLTKKETHSQESSNL